MDWSVKQWAIDKCKQKYDNDADVEKEWERMKSDKVHFHPWVYTMLIDEVFGPAIFAFFRIGFMMSGALDFCKNSSRNMGRFVCAENA